MRRVLDWLNYTEYGRLLVVVPIYLIVVWLISQVFWRLGWFGPATTAFWAVALLWPAKAIVLGR